LRHFLRHRKLTSTKDSEGPSLEARAAVSSYVVLGGFWFVIAVANWVLALINRMTDLALVAFLSCLIGLLWVCWLKGFRLRINNGQLQYRNGFYSSVTVPLAEITDFRSTWVETKVLGQALRMPRLVVAYDARRILINTKPFRKEDLRALFDALKRARGSVTSPAS